MIALFQFITGLLFMCLAIVLFIIGIFIIMCIFAGIGWIGTKTGIVDVYFYGDYIGCGKYKVSFEAYARAGFWTLIKTILCLFAILCLGVAGKLIIYA